MSMVTLAQDHDIFFILRVAPFRQLLVLAFGAVAGNWVVMLSKAMSDVRNNERKHICTVFYSQNKHTIIN